MVSKCPMLVLRISVDDTHSMFSMSTKFGAKLETCPALLKRAQELGLDVIGVSFHVGSYCMDPVSYTKAIKNAKDIFDLAATIGYKMTFMDLGGGYPGFDIPNVVHFKQVIIFPLSQKAHSRCAGEPQVSSHKRLMWM
ncbi:ornithine decarboxylase 1-like [Conger conger]|uniref:ornithine decarboxylase 1-like n=1 Tax=Conger conger TaxID=82655 RepID=UPI002A59D945|nr:ornithine decarboxylase 1-like [Conger conger]